MGKGVSFEVQDLDNSVVPNRTGNNNSPSTISLVTDSVSEDDEEEGHDGNSLMGNVHCRYDKHEEIQEQYGYEPRRLNRIKLRHEHELDEFNFGIDFTQLKNSKDQQKRLWLYLRKHMSELNAYVESGTGPVFGYPPICYSPPNELKKDNREREFIAVLYRHVF